MSPVKNQPFQRDSTTEVSAFGYDATLCGVDVGKVRAYLDVDTVVFVEISPRAFREMQIADGLLRATMDWAADQNILYYTFAEDILEEIPTELFAMGYKPKGDYIFRFFQENKHCDGNCADCHQH